MKEHQPTYALLPSMAEENFVGALLMKVFIHFSATNESW